VYRWSTYCNATYLFTCRNNAYLQKSECRGKSQTHSLAVLSLMTYLRARNVFGSLATEVLIWVQSEFNVHRKNRKNKWLLCCTLSVLVRKAVNNLFNEKTFLANKNSYKSIENAVDQVVENSMDIVCIPLYPLSRWPSNVDVETWVSLSFQCNSG